jgi:hypothetical protein
MCVKYVLCFYKEANLHQEYLTLGENLMEPVPHIVPLSGFQSHL